MKYFLILVLGILVGGAAVFFLVVGVPRAKTMPGTAIGPPTPGGDPPGTALVSVDEQFFNSVLSSIFKDLQPPSMPLKLTSLDRNQSDQPFQFRNIAFEGQCTDQVVLVAQGSGITSAVKFSNGKIETPLAFTGSYNAPILGCMKFTGWAQANMQLSFDQKTQTVYGHINVDGINLDGIQPGINNLVTSLVQNAINEHVNPIEVLRAQQLTLSVPVKSSNGTLKAQVKDVRQDIKDGSLRFHVSYDFSGVKNP